MPWRKLPSPADTALLEESSAPLAAQRPYPVPAAEDRAEQLAPEQFAPGLPFGWLQTPRPWLSRHHCEQFPLAVAVKAHHGHLQLRVSQ